MKVSSSIIDFIFILFILLPSPFHSEKLKKEKLQAMKETGMYTPETFTVEMAENLERERRRLQLEVCEVSR